MLPCGTTQIVLVVSREICELLLEAEADIEACDAAGRTALWAAASAGHAGTARLLLFWGACVDTMDGEGRTVLSTAAAQGQWYYKHTQTHTGAQLCRGACVDTVDGKGRMVLSTAGAQC